MIIETDYPDADELTYNLELLGYAANMWKISGSSLPPQPHEILYRDKDWDRQVYRVRQAIDYIVDEPKRKAAKLS